MKLRGNKLTAAVKLCFAAAVILALSTGFVRAVFFPKDVNEYESRMANQLPAFTAGAFSDSSLQDSAEDALSDQLPLSTYLKKAYNLLSYKYQELCSRGIPRGACRGLLEEPGGRQKQLGGR